ncbi:hypothetical protein [Methylorubrum sp. SB2]|uniref:hypothetical protein n=1 Tax=Methylorubrum subtropicum TaxID=3138812 RepID=UPI00313C0510
MVRLSPKALRFAEDAVRSLPETADRNDPPRIVWDRWREERAPDAVRPGGAVEVPDPVARVLLSAVEQRVEAMQRSFDQGEDEDDALGNDLLFLRNVRDVLRGCLPEAQRAAV